MPEVTRSTYVERGLIDRVRASHGEGYAAVIDPRAPEAHDRVWTVLETRSGTIRWTDDVVSAQFFDAYGHQRELTLDLRHRDAGVSSDAPRQCALSAYVHPFRGAHGHAPIVIPRSRARRLYERIVSLASDHPILLMNEDREGNTRGAWEGLVSFMDAIVNGADPSVRLLP